MAEGSAISRVGPRSIAERRHSWSDTTAVWYHIRFFDIFDGKLMKLDTEIESPRVRSASWIMFTSRMYSEGSRNQRSASELIPGEPIQELGGRPFATAEA